MLPLPDRHYQDIAGEADRITDADRQVSNSA